LHVDPLKFSDTTIASFTRIEEVKPEWKAELDRWNVQTVMVKSKSPLAKALAKEPAWQTWYRDTTATVFRRSEAPASGQPIILPQRRTSTTSPESTDKADGAPRD
jgi:hypothetical protein